MRLLFWLCRVFGRWPFRVVLYPVLLWYVIDQTWARAASSDYLAARGRSLTVRPVRRPAALGVLRHFASFGESILDKMLLWGGLFDTDAVSIHGDRADRRPRSPAKRGGCIDLLPSRQSGTLPRPVKTARPASN